MSNGMGIDGMIVGRIGINRDAEASFFCFLNDRFPNLKYEIRELTTLLFAFLKTM